MSSGEGPPIFRLPNEILLTILDQFLSKDLVNFARVCRQFHSLTLRLFHARLQSATTLEGHTLFLECGPPEARLTTTKVLCSSLDINNLADHRIESHNPIGQFHALAKLYSRFRPITQDVESFRPVRQRHPAGDIPGSRTYAGNSQNVDEDDQGHDDDNDLGVTLNVGVDAHALFSQLETVAYLAQMEALRGRLLSVHPVCEATIRVWRQWLAKQCVREARAGDDEVEGAMVKGSVADEAADPHLDPSVLWINTLDESVGIKFRVREQKWRRDVPVLFADEIEAPVSYRVTLDEVLIRTTHLLLQLEDAREQMENSSSGNAVVFGSYLNRATR